MLAQKPAKNCFFKSKRIKFVMQERLAISQPDGGMEVKR